MKRIPLVLVMMWLVASCAPAIQTQYDYNPAANFAAFKTFAWAGEHPMSVAMGTDQSLSPFWEPMIMRAIERNLAAKGFRQVPNHENADLAVAFTIGARDKIDVRTTPVTYRGYYGRGPYGHGSGWGVSHGTQTTVKNYTEGALSIDIFDTRSKEPVWYGIGTRKMYGTPKQEGREQRVNEGVDLIMATFPPGYVAPGS